MAEDQDKDNKTEEPTERKLRQARDKGDVASSREVGTLMAVLSLFAIAVFVLPQVAAPFAGLLGQVLSTAGQVEVGIGSTGLRDLGTLTRGLLRGVVLLLSPMVLLMVLGAFAGIALQGEVVAAPERLKPKWSKISPAAGLKRLFSAAGFVEFLKSVTKVMMVGAIAVWVTVTTVGELWQGQGLLPEFVGETARGAAARMLVYTLVLVAVIALADVFWKRFDHRRKQRMSMKDIKDEMKDTEGDPQIRSKRQSLRRQRARQRIASAVPRATVILTNPTHYAVALKYESGVDLAPICLAKGTDLMAAQIRRIARDADIPIVENRPLARALHDVAEVNREIPVQHWEAVASIIGFLLDLKRDMRRPPPEGSRLRGSDEDDLS